MNDAPTQPRTSPPAGAWRDLPLGDLLRAGGIPLLVLLVLALVAKLLLWGSSANANPLWDFPTSDIAYYLDQARWLNSGRAILEPFHMPPLYPRLLAWTGAASGAVGSQLPVGASMLMLQIGAGMAGLALVWVAAARRVGPRWALIAPALCLAYGPLSFFELKALGDSLAVNLLLAALVVLEALPGCKRPERASALAGLLLGLTALLRPQALLLLPLIGFWCWRRGRGRALAGLLVASALSLLPSTLHNIEHGAGLTLVSDNGAFNLWLAHTGPMSGSFATDRPEFGNISTQARVARALASQAAGRELSWAESSAHWRSEALATVFGAPLQTLERVGLRAAALTESFSTGIVTIPEVEMGFGWLPTKLLRFGLLLGAMLGLWVAAGRPRPSSYDVPWLMVAAGVSISTLMFFHYERFRLPLIPGLALGCAVLAARVFSSTRDRSARRATRLALGAFVLAAVTAQSYLPRTHHANTLANGWASAAEAATPELSDSDFFDAQATAQASYDRALEHDPRLPRALIGTVTLGWSHLLFQRGASTDDRGRAAALFDELGTKLTRAEAVLGPQLPELLEVRALLHLSAPSTSPWHDEQAALKIYQGFEERVRQGERMPPRLVQVGVALRERGLR